MKFNGILPWEHDGDIVFHEKNFSTIEALKDKVEHNGYKFTTVNSRHFLLKNKNVEVDLWAIKQLSTPMDVAKGVVPTKVMFAGQWVSHPHNPGLFARDRYGPGIYKHQEHWRQVNHSSSWQFYNPGTFNECPLLGDSSCLDQYPTDGNMQFCDYCPL